MTELERYEPVQTTLLRSPARERTDGWVDVIQPVAELAEQVANTEFVPKGLRGKPAAITAAILYGRELEMPPMQALANIHVVDGRPGLAAEQMRAMVLAAGHDITYPVFKGTQVIARGRRRGPDGVLGEPTDVEWNTAMVQWAGLAGKDNHKKYPRAMLTARATADLCRLIFPDVTRGLPALEELEDGGQTPESAASGSSTQDEPKSKVSRRPSSGTTKKAPGTQSVPPVRTDSTPGAPPRPPLPGAGGAPVAGSTDPVAGEPAPERPLESVPAGQTPGEGQPENTSTPAGTAEDGPEVTPDAPVADLPRTAFCELEGPDNAHEEHGFKAGRTPFKCPGYDLEQCSVKVDHSPGGHFWSADYARHWCVGVPPEDAAFTERQCPTISNGQQCRYRAGHTGQHTYGGGLGDSVELRRCAIPEEHVSHAWNPKPGVWYACSGDGDLTPSDVGLLASEGDGSPDDVAATGTDEAYAESVAVDPEFNTPRPDDYPEAEIVPDRPEGIHPGQKRALEAAFTSLKIADRAQRHHAASALLGRQVTTFKSITDDPGGLSANDGSRLLSAMANVSTVEQLEELIQDAAEKWGGERP